MPIEPFNSKKYRTKYNNDGSVKKYGLFLNEKTKEPVSRLPPSFKWFQPTRVITNSALDDLTKKLSVSTPNTFEVVLNKGNLPFSLFDGSENKQNS